ncbi:MAG: glucuronate isomerase [Calditrichaceae bacterium]|nr:glucuronate isomerase [Calditrichaceae bacterium]MBN2708178.1 glucuronate isomerase [Calditrichaceae bacterium]RQV97176.1 MAG: glucuronate isomerase [Calditrichota bacterium]
MAKLELNEYRLFDPEPGVRKIARELYEQVKDLPIISPHGHVDPMILADNKPFPDPTELILIPDHYAHRMLYSQGVPLESLGIPSVDGTPVEKDHRKIWQIFGDHFYLFAGTPTGVWLNHEFYEVFGIREKFNGQSALRIYDQIQEKLNSPEFLPRALFKCFNIEVLSTTDGASDTLEQHKKIKESGWDGRVVPCLRPDAIVSITAPNWKPEINKLEKTVGYEISSFKNYIRAIEDRRKFFKAMGATSTDQGVYSPYTHELNEAEAEAVFQRGLKGQASEDDGNLFTAHMLMEMARMSVEDGLVMQIHPGSFRNHNQVVFKRFGADKGCDIPVATEYTNNLRALLNKYGYNPALTLIVFTLDETTYARELAPLAGHYPALRLGPAWWFHDSYQGMTRYRQMVTETAGIYNTVGFNDDTRAFPSIPARHDVSRRVDSNFLARMVTSHLIDMEEAQKLSKALAYELVKKAYKL